MRDGNGALSRGESIHPDIRMQFHCPVPFEGHHREFTLDEVLWMLSETGLQPLASETFNYSIYGCTLLKGYDILRFHRMEADPKLREIIFVTARKSNTSGI